MNLILTPNSECKCRDCNKKIWRTEPRFKANEGHYCVEHGRVKRFHDKSMQWISDNFKQVMQIDNGMPLTARVINWIYKRLER